MLKRFLKKIKPFYFSALFIVGLFYLQPFLVDIIKSIFTFTKGWVLQDTLDWNLKLFIILLIGLIAFLPSPFYSKKWWTKKGANLPGYLKYGIVITLFATGIIYLGVVLLEFSQSDSALIKDWDHGKDVVIVIGAITGILLTLFRNVAFDRQSKAAMDQARIAQEGQLNDRFVKAMDMFSTQDEKDDKGNVKVNHVTRRVAGVYALEALTRDYHQRGEHEQYWSILDILCDFLREHAEARQSILETLPTPAQAQTEEVNKSAKEAYKEAMDAWVKNNKSPADIHAIMRVLGRLPKYQRSHEKTPPIPGLNLQNILIVGLELNYSRFPHAWFIGSKVISVGFSEADLTEADLTEANLWRANLNDAILTDANLTDANLGRANLWGADLTEANLARAKLIEAKLIEANLTKAYLWEANLTEANLGRANLTKAYLWEANLTEANLWEANLGRAYLEGAKNANLAKNLDSKWLKEGGYEINEEGTIIEQEEE